MGSLVRCAACKERCGSRPVGTYWRWMRADGVWKKYYARLCAGCVAAKVLPLDVTYESGQNLTCPACGIDTEADYDAVYLTSFPGGRDALSIDAPFCGPCAAAYRIWVVDVARDVESLDGAPEPHRVSPAPTATPANELMKALGRR